MRVFIVDDHPLVREWLANLINQQPDLVVCGQAASAAEALPAVTAADSDAAIVDISLKDASGLDLIRDLKRTCPALTVLALSMHEETLFAERALNAGAKDYIVKREATWRIIEVLRRLSQGQF